MQKFINYIRKYVNLTEDEVYLLQHSFEVIELHPNETFFSQGQLANEIYFVLQGWIRLFYNVEIEDKTAFFYKQGQFICAGESYNNATPALENYQAITNSRILILTREKIEELLTHYPKLEEIGRIAVENELIASQKVIASFVTQTAEERYLHLLENDRALFQEVPQHYIASYLGISPETLSRIKSRILKK